MRLPFPFIRSFFSQLRHPYQTTRRLANDATVAASSIVVTKFNFSSDDDNSYQRTHRRHFVLSLTGLGFLLGLVSNDNTNDRHKQFPITVRCAQIAVPPSTATLTKDRLSAIKSLNVISDVAQETQPAVVSVKTSDRGLFPRIGSSTGSGFILDTNGHVITNAHVVNYRASAYVHLSDGRSFPGRVLAVDVSSDLALIKLDVDATIAKTLPHISLTKDIKTIRPGHFVLALGSPLMLANSVTVGVVSALDRDLGHPQGLRYIQTDAIITFGNSGGPLVNLFGEVIGVNAMIAGTGVGFAIPADQVQRFAELAIEKTLNTSKAPTIPVIGSGDSHILTEASKPPHGSPTRRYLGLVMRTLTPELAFELASRGAGPQFMEVTEGVFIHAVMHDSPAQRAGLKPGDIIVAIDGVPISNARQVYTATEEREALSLTVVRRGQRINFDGVRTESV